jgi:hypothetical protein
MKQSFSATKNEKNGKEIKVEVKNKRKKQKLSRKQFSKAFLRV